MGFDQKKLNRIDSFAQKVIDSAMTPGMQIFISRKGKMVYQKVLVTIHTKKGSCKKPSYL